MNIIVTGGHGFLGRHVVAAIRNRGGDAVPLGRRDGDLKNPFAAHSLLKDADVIVHLAADVGGLGYLRTCRARGFHDNHQIGLNVIAAACAGRAERLVLAGTPCSYAGDSPLPLREQNLDHGVPSGDTGTYGFAKLAISKTAEAFCPTHGVEPVTVIPANLYGPHDNFGVDRAHVAAALLRKAVVASQLGEPSFDVWGDGSATRDFVFVRDVAEAIATVAVAQSSRNAGRTFNLGSGQETSMRQLACLIADTVGNVAPEFSTSKPVGYTHRVMSIAEATRLLGYAPQTPLADGLAETYAWAQQHGLVEKWVAEERQKPGLSLVERHHAA